MLLWLICCYDSYVVLTDVLSWLGCRDDSYVVLTHLLLWLICCSDSYIVMIHMLFWLHVAQTICSYSIVIFLWLRWLPNKTTWPSGTLRNGKWLFSFPTAKCRFATKQRKGWSCFRCKRLWKQLSATSAQIWMNFSQKVETKRRKVVLEI